MTIARQVVPPRRKLRETRFWHAYHASRYTILFYALLLTLVITPIASTVGLPQLLIKILIGLSLCAAVMPSATRRTAFLFLTAVSLLVIIRIGSDQGYVPVKSGLAIALVGFTGIVAAAKALEFAVTSKIVTRQTIYAALSTYLLAGLFFGQVYWAVETLWPKSLVGPDPTTEARSVYYSFVTLATLGYGDFVPRTDIARGLAVLEVIGGQLFLAVMVARLIGLFERD